MNTNSFTKLLCRLPIGIGLAFFLATGCVNSSFPKDPKHTLEKVTGDKLVVGITEHKPFTIEESSSQWVGIEVELVKQFAQELDAKIVWVEGSESELMDLLKHNHLNLVIAGLDKATIWKSEAGLTRPYYHKHVLAVQQGENAFLMRLEQFLSRHQLEITQLYTKYHAL